MLDKTQDKAPQKIGVVVTHYNELSREGYKNWMEKMDSLNYLANNHGFNVVVIDNNSTDGSIEKLKKYSENENSSIDIVYQSKKDQVNAWKTGTNNSGDIDYVILKDFDHDFSESTSPRIQETVDGMDKEGYDAAAFSMRVKNNDTILGAFDNIELKMTAYEVDFCTKNDGKMRVISRSGGIYRKKLLEKLLDQHSGRNEGNDMELTARAYMNDAKIKYLNDMIVETNSKDSFLDVMKQRSGWYQGAMEAFMTLPDYYGKDIKKMDRFGFSIALEIGGYAFNVIPGALLLPDMAYNYTAVANVWKDLTKKEKMLAPVLPFYRFSLYYPAINMAIGKLAVKGTKKIASKLKNKIKKIKNGSDEI